MDDCLIVNCSGNKRWYLDDQLHRENGPAIIWNDGPQTWWWHHGQLHRENGPAIIWEDGSQWWYQHGKRINVEKWIKDNNLPSWESWDNVIWSLFRLEFL